MAYNKVTYNGNTLIDLTADTIQAADLLAGKTAHGADGESITGAMVNRGAVSGTIGAKDTVVAIQQGFHNGNGAVQISPTEQAKIIPENIAQGITLLGIQGAHSGQQVTTQEVPNATGIGYVITVS